MRRSTCAEGDLSVVGGPCLGRYDKDIGPISAGGTFGSDILNALSDPCSARFAMAVIAELRCTNAALAAIAVAVERSGQGTKSRINPLDQLNPAPPAAPSR